MPGEQSFRQGTSVMGHGANPPPLSGGSANDGSQSSILSPNCRVSEASHGETVCGLPVLQGYGRFCGRGPPRNGGLRYGKLFISIFALLGAPSV